MSSRENRKREAHQIIAGTAGAVAILLVLLAAVETSMDVQAITGLLEAAILLGTAYIVWRYTEETRRLRLEAQRQVEAAYKQIEVQQRPSLIAEFHRRGPLIVRNIGNSAAINIKIRVVNGTRTITIPLLTHGSGISIQIESDRDRPTDTYVEEGILTHNNSLFIDHDSVQNGFTLHIEYQNVAMVVYVTEERITPEGFRILRSEATSIMGQRRP